MGIYRVLWDTQVHKGGGCPHLRSIFWIYIYEHSTHTEQVHTYIESHAPKPFEYKYMWRI